MSNHADKTREYCISCGEELTGKYCANCGEKVIDLKDYSVLNFLREAFEAITTIDNKLLRSLGIVFARPGLFANAYVIGRRNRYLKPVQLFIFVNVMYFFVFALLKANLLALPLQTHISTLSYQKIADKMVKAEVQKRGIHFYIYSIIAIRDFYRQRWYWAIVESLFLTVGFVVVFGIYQIILFFVTVYTI